MPTLHLPVSFEHSVKTQRLENGKLKTEVNHVASATSPISVPYSGPLGKSFTEEALENKTVLELEPGETKKFSKEEADFLTDRYPFIEVVDSNPSVVKAPSVKALGDDEVPTNYMKLKAYAKEKGVQVEKTDKKADLLRKLAELNS